MDKNERAIVVPLRKLSKEEMILWHGGEILHPESYRPAITQMLINKANKKKWALK